MPPTSPELFRYFAATLPRRRACVYFKPRMTLLMLIPVVGLLVGVVMSWWEGLRALIQNGDGLTGWALWVYWVGYVGVVPGFILVAGVFTAGVWKTMTQAWAAPGMPRMALLPPDTAVSWSGQILASTQHQQLEARRMVARHRVTIDALLAHGGAVWLVHAAGWQGLFKMDGQVICRRRIRLRKDR